MYSELFWTHVREPRRQLKASEPPLQVSGKSFYQRCGDKLEVHLDLEEPSGDDQLARISKARFLAKGCAPVIAVADFGCSLLEGLTIEKARELSSLEMDRVLGPLPVSKRHAYILFLECLNSALDQTQTHPKGQKS